jgi:hypothetical protein
LLPLLLLLQIYGSQNFFSLSREFTHQLFCKGMVTHDHQPINTQRPPHDWSIAVSVDATAIALCAIQHNKKINK